MYYSVVQSVEVRSSLPTETARIVFAGPPNAVPPRSRYAAIHFTGASRRHAKRVTDALRFVGDDCLRGVGRVWGHGEFFATSMLQLRASCAFHFAVFVVVAGRRTPNQCYGMVE